MRNHRRLRHLQRTYPLADGYMPQCLTVTCYNIDLVQVDAAPLHGPSKLLSEGKVQVADIFQRSGRARFDEREDARAQRRCDGDFGVGKQLDPDIRRGGEGDNAAVGYVNAW